MALLNSSTYDHGWLNINTEDTQDPLKEESLKSYTIPAERPDFELPTDWTATQSLPKFKSNVKI